MNYLPYQVCILCAKAVQTTKLVSMVRIASGYMLFVRATLTRKPAKALHGYCTYFWLMT